MASNKVTLDQGTLIFYNGTSALGRVKSNVDGNIQFRNGDGTGTCTISGFADSSDADGLVTKAYVDSYVQGLSVKRNAHAATAAALANVGGGVWVYNAGDGTLTSATASDATPATMDGVTVTLNRYYLIKDGFANAVTGAVGQNTGDGCNGLYKCTQVGDNTPTATIFTRSDDMDVAAEFPGATVHIEEGTTNEHKTLVCHADSDTFSLNGGVSADSDVVFQQLSSSGFSIAGNGLTASGSTVDAAGTVDRISVTADAIDIASTYVGQTSITTVGAIGSGSWTATPIANNYVAQDLTISGGVIDGSVIGGTTAAAGDFTTLGATTSIKLGTTGAANHVLIDTNGISFEGATGDGTNITTLAVADPSAPRTITFPDATGTVCTAATASGALNTMSYGSGLTLATQNAIELSAAPPAAITDDGHVMFFLSNLTSFDKVFPATTISDSNVIEATGMSGLANANYDLAIISTKTGVGDLDEVTIIDNVAWTNGTNSFAATSHGLAAKSATPGDHLIFVLNNTPGFTQEAGASFNMSANSVASSVYLPGALTGTPQTSPASVIVGRGLYTNGTSVTALTYAGEAGQYDGSAAQVMTVDYDDSTIGISTTSNALEVKDNGITNAKLFGNIQNTKLANYQISGVDLGSNLNALSFGDILTVGSAGVTLSSTVGGTVPSGAQLFFFPDGANLQGVSGFSGIAGNVATFDTDMATTLSGTKYLYVINITTPSTTALISSNVSIVASGNGTVDNAAFSGGTATDYLAFIFADTPPPNPRDTTANNVSVSAAANGTATVNGTVTNGALSTSPPDIVIGAGVYAKGAAVTALTLSTINTATFDGQAVKTLSMSGTLAEFNTALSDGSFVSLAGTETLTNKTLTTPVISSGGFTMKDSDNSHTYTIDGALVTDATITLPTATTTLVGHDTTNTLTNKTLTEPKMTDTSFIADDAGLALLGFTKTSTSVNYLRIINAATGDHAEIQAEGSDADVGLHLRTQGTGAIYCSNDANANQIIINSNHTGTGRFIGLDGDVDLMKLENGAITVAGTISSSSDRRLKRQIEDCGGLDLVCQMAGKKWEFIKSGEHSAGVVAQDLQKVAPYMVKTDKESGFLSVKYQELSGPFINAFKDVRAELDELRALVTGGDMDKKKTKKVTRDRAAKNQGDDSSDSDVTPSRYNLRRRRKC